MKKLTDEQIGLLTTDPRFAHVEVPLLVAFARAVEGKLAEQQLLAAQSEAAEFTLDLVDQLAKDDDMDLVFRVALDVSDAVTEDDQTVRLLRWVRILKAVGCAQAGT